MKLVPLVIGGVALVAVAYGGYAMLSSAKVLSSSKTCSLRGSNSNDAWCN